MLPCYLFFTLFSFPLCISFIFGGIFVVFAERSPPPPRLLLLSTPFFLSPVSCLYDTTFPPPPGCRDFSRVPSFLSCFNVWIFPCVEYLIHTYLIPVTTCTSSVPSCFCFVFRQLFVFLFVRFFLLCFVC